MSLIFDLCREPRNGKFPQPKFSGHSLVNNIERLTGKGGEEERVDRTVGWYLRDFKV